jgi:hypothetical protein
MTELINAVSEAGLGIASVLVLAYLVLQQNKTIQQLGSLIDKNTEAIHGLKDVVSRMCDQIDKK